MLKFLKRNTLLVCYSILLCLICFTPIIQQKLSNLWTAVLWGGYVIFFLNQILACGDIALNKIRNLWILYIILCSVYIITGVSEGVIWGIMPTIISIIPLFIFYLIYTHCDENQLHSIFHIFCFIIAFNIADGIRIVSIYHVEVTYQSLVDALDMVGITGLNLGGTAFINMTLFYLNVVLIAFFNATNKLEKYIFGLYSAIAIFFDVIVSLKASVVLIAVLSVVLQYIAHRAKNFKKAFGWTIVTFLFFYLFRNFFIHLLVDTIGSDRISVRLLSFTSDSADEGNIETFTGRSDLWLLSIKTWLRNPLTFLFGIGDKLKMEGQSAYLVGIGNHSDLLDTLAKYGIIGASFLYGAFINLYKYLKSISNRNVKVILAFFVVLLSAAISKKILFPEVGFLIFCLMPICINIYIKKDMCF